MISNDTSTKGVLNASPGFYKVNFQCPLFLSIRIYSSFEIAIEASECPGSTWHNRFKEDPSLGK